MRRVFAATLLAGLAAGFTMAPNISGATGDTAAQPQAQGQTIAAVSTTALKLILPLPSTVRPGSGELPVTNTFSIEFKGYTEPRLERASQRFMRELAGVTGLSIGSGTADASKPILVATTDHCQPSAIQNIDDDESYTLDVTPAGATIHAATPLGTMHAFQTFLQLVQVTQYAAGLPPAPSVHVQRHATRCMARIDDRFRPPFHADRYAKAQHRRHGSREAQRAALAPFRKSGFSRRE